MQDDSSFSSGYCFSSKRRRTGLKLIARSAPLWALVGVCNLAALTPPPPAFAAPKREGDILRIFDNARVYVVTNDDPRLVEALLGSTRQKERRVVSLEEWAKIPDSIRQWVTVVHLINREKLPDAIQIPVRCATVEPDELYLDVVRTGQRGGITYQVAISAPDGAWLRQGISEFRRLSQVPRDPNRRVVNSLAVVPVGTATALTAESIVRDASRPNRRSHLLLAQDREKVTPPRLAAMDELVLIDRSVAPPPSLNTVIEQALDGKTFGKNDTIAWSEAKPGGHRRIFVCGPSADQVAEGLKHLPEPLDASEIPTVLCTARDLRTVRRVAVVAVRAHASGGSDTAPLVTASSKGPAPLPEAPDDARAEMTRRLAVKAATELRTLDAFEVLERAALSEILGEIALGQAGITKATDRARVRQLAAADALLLVEITDVSGRTDYSASHRRLSPPIGSPPRRPNLPSRSRLGISISSDGGVQKAVDGVLGKVLGRKSDDDFDREMRLYERETLPMWQRQMADYDNLMRYGTVNWEETVTATTNVTVSGSMRLVDLTDGLVLWEAPITASSDGRRTLETRNVTSRGEGSQPDTSDLPETKTEIPVALASSAAENAVTKGINSLRGTALLPSAAPPPVTFDGGTMKKDAPKMASGRVLDIDGDTLLVGLGVADGLQVGDTLTVDLGEGQGAVSVTVTRVRPRTCDAAFVEGTDMALRGRIAVGQAARKQ